MLDISFNRVTELKNLDALSNLRKLFLCCNKIPTIQNLSNLSNLTMLELGDNKIRVSKTKVRNLIKTWWEHSEFKLVHGKRSVDLKIFNIFAPHYDNIFNF